MGPRNLTILFISTVAVSLVLLILFFSLFFKNVDLSFDTKMPESAPDLGNFYKDGQAHTKGDNVGGANVRVPAGAPPAPAAPSKPASGVGDEDLSKLQEENQEAEDSASEDTEETNAAPTPGGAPLPGTTPSSKPTAGTSASPVTKPPTPKPAAPAPRPQRIDPEPPPPSNPAPVGADGTD